MVKLDSATAGLQIHPARFRNSFSCHYVSKPPMEQQSIHVSPPPAIIIPSVVFIGYESLTSCHQPVHIKFSRRLFVFCCVALSTSVEAPCCSLFSLKMTFDVRATKIWKRIVRIETPLHHARWCYLKPLDIPPLFVPLCHLILVITTGIRLFFFFLLYILIQHKRLKTEVQNLLLRKEVKLCICTNFPQIERA